MERQMNMLVTLQGPTGCGKTKASNVMRDALEAAGYTMTPTFEGRGSDSFMMAPPVIEVVKPVDTEKAELLASCKLLSECLVSCLTGGEVSAKKVSAALLRAADLIEKAEGEIL